MRQFSYCLYCAVVIIFITISASLSAAPRHSKAPQGEDTDLLKRTALQFHVNAQVKAGLKAGEQQTLVTFLKYVKKRCNIKYLVFLRPRSVYVWQLSVYVARLRNKKNWIGLKLMETTNPKELTPEVCRLKRALVFSTDVRELGDVFRNSKSHCLVVQGDEQFLNFDLSKFLSIQ